ncbi:DeoR/GlpR family DNA-binding transcription regulator [Cobetia crustatorum]|uniref:DeoR/GlpR transcriptional regulator n=1 Tax=Cobetia crustatorum TaxID=553385 RepID=A0A558HE05_9GAMM|nr:DeoR/GlpR family DNA-binding transcription regulator [Cobetia crustatorum]TVU67369.1 DeoR/GlpR transcriptional regulator [Cobetia crustatorum]
MNKNVEIDSQSVENKGAGSQRPDVLTTRQQQILERLAREGQLAVEPLAAHFSVTPQTIRRDLGALCERGLARRRHGGIKRPPGGHNLVHSQRSVMARSAKQKMAARVVDEIPDGASLALGIGTSVVAVAEALIARRGLRVITNNLQVAQVLSNHPDIGVQLAEGRLRPQDLDVVGSATVAFFTRHQVDIAVLGCGGLDAKGLLDFDPEEAAVSRALLDHAQRRILVVDASKWGRAAMCRIGTLNAVDLLVTDEPPHRADYRTALNAAGKHSLQVRFTT